ncbi:MAG TPA: ABC transporter ATP-binding protein [Anaerolineales bacterium]
MDKDPGARAMIQIDELTKVFTMGENEVHALDGVSLSIARGEMVAIMGPSGSGKSTLMSIVGCLDVPTSGSYLLDGSPVENMNDTQLADVRNRKIGFVFQQFNLLSRTSALENVLLPLSYTGLGGRASREKALQALDVVGLTDRVSHHPSELSGGQQQRVAIARAIVNDPAILIADEPTGALDSHTGAEIMELFQSLHREVRQTVIMVTHDAFIARHAGRIIRLADGRITSDTVNPNPLKAGARRDDADV